ncbi:MAG: hypothetical protein ACLQU2_16230 [Candidatus Binataceae bacterium]
MIEKGPHLLRNSRHGMLDGIVPRHRMRETLPILLRIPRVR